MQYSFETPHVGQEVPRNFMAIVSYLKRPRRGIRGSGSAEYLLETAGGEWLGR
jgi:hypothetical protein